MSKNAVPEQVAPGCHNKYWRQPEQRATDISYMVARTGSPPGRSARPPAATDARTGREHAGRCLGLGRRALSSTEERREQDAPGDMKRGREGWLVAVGAAPHRDVVRHVGAGHEHAGAVRRRRFCDSRLSVGGQRGIGRATELAGEGGRTVVDGFWEAVLGGKTVVGREHDRGELGGDAQAARVDCAEADPAAVEVDELLRW